MTTIKETLKTDLFTAMKSGDELAKTTLRAVMGAIQTAEKSGKTAVEFNDDKVLSVLFSEMKKRVATAQEYAEVGHVDRAARETAEAEFIRSYLPKQLDRTEIEVIVEKVVADLGDNPHFGAVMKAVTAQTKGKADGRLVSDIVKTRLES